MGYNPNHLQRAPAGAQSASSDGRLQPLAEPMSATTTAIADRPSAIERPQADTALKDVDTIGAP